MIVQFRVTLGRHGCVSLMMWLGLCAGLIAPHTAFAQFTSPLATLKIVEISPSLAAWLAVAQVQQPQVKSTEHKADAGAVAAEAAADADKSAQQTPKPKEDPLIAALLALTFDRSPANIFKEWSRSLLPEEPKDADVDETPGQAPAPPSAQVMGTPPNVSAVIMSPDGVPIQVPSGPGGTGKQTVTASPAALSPEEQQALAAAREKAEAFQRDVVLSHWQQVKGFLAELPEDGAAKVYDHLLSQLSQPTSRTGAQTVHIGKDAAAMVVHRGGEAAGAAKTVLAPDDLIGMIQSAPCELTTPRLARLARCIAVVRANGHTLDGVAAALDAGLGALGGEDAKPRHLAGRMLLDGNELDLASRFLPDWHDEPVRSDSFAVELLADFHHANHRRDKKLESLQQSWEIHQVLATLDDTKPKVLEKALTRLTEMSAQVDKEHGTAWMQECFSGDTNRGVRLVTICGTKTASNLQVYARQPDHRLQSLRLQKMAIESLLSQLTADDGSWQSVLTRMAETWCREADWAYQYTRDPSSRMQMQWDAYGNFFYADDEMMARQMHGQNPNQPMPIPIRDLLEMAPHEEWVAKVDSSLWPNLSLWMARLHLKQSDEAAAFPSIEKLAPLQPRTARDLVHQFLTVWTHTHDPNSMRRMYNPYVYIYGYNTQAEAIPLTRSKQQRNLADLQRWIERIRKLPIEPIDESHLVKAFTKCHSSAEVYRLSAFEEVFGDLGALDAKTVAKLADSMRVNLASVWRKVTTQEEQKTKRKEREVQAEVLRGYDVALNVVEHAQRSQPDDWRLLLARAALEFDKNAYQQEVNRTTEFTQRRQQAFAVFRSAAEAYAHAAEQLDQSEQTADAFCTWFYAALGASELSQVSHENVPQSKEYAKIREVLDGLSPTLRDIHVGRFAEQLFSRMSSVQPQAKLRYLRGGIEIVGDHARAREARKSLDYYTDIVRELELNVRIDGSDNVGYTEPFGLLVTLLHTPEIERESGGFEKYVQNQNMAGYYFNYGRPLENYRDKFQAATVAAMDEHFEVLSVTFENPKQMRSRTSERSGWRETPFAYVLVKARGPEVDKLPRLTLNLDFLDATGFVVIPIESSAIPVNARGDVVDARPVRDLRIVQTLDERLSDEEKLALEIKATAKGLVPELDSILHLKFANLKVENVVDQGTSPTEFDGESDTIDVLCDRSWIIELVPDPTADGDSREFTFCAVHAPDTECSYQRYDDVDLVSADATIRLSRSVAGSSVRRWWWPLAMLMAATGLIALVLVGRIWRQAAKGEARYLRPSEVNPFTVMALLERMQGDQPMGSPVRAELEQSMREIQQDYFARTNGKPAVDLQQVVGHWVHRLSGVE